MEKKEEIYDLLKDFSILAAFFVGAGAMKYQVSERLKLDWRKWMTQEYTTAWTGNNNYYKIQMNNLVDNPDQRIADDISQLTSGTLGLGLGALRASTSLLSFSYILWNMSGPATAFGVTVPGYLMFAAIGYATLGTMLGHKLGKPLVAQNQEQQKRDANLRYALVNARNNTEAIALSGGDKIETKILTQKMDDVVENKLRLITKEKQMLAFNNSYNQVAIIAPYVLTLPRLVEKGVTLGDFFQCAGAFQQVQTDLSWVFNSYSDLANWKSVANRLTSFDAAIQATDAMKPEISVRATESGSVQFDNLSLNLADGTPLFSDFSLTLNPGDRLAITGAMGSGKSSIFRAMRNLWMNGSGRIEMPASASTLVLTQKAYFPLTSLKGIIAYPHAAEDYTDSDAEEALRKIGMERLIPDMNDSVKDGPYWASRLSGGEQQSIAFARAVLQKPDILMLDEATAAMHEEAQEKFYSLITKELPGSIIISISHRMEVVKHHTIRAKLEKQRITIEPVPSIIPVAGISAPNGPSMPV